MISGPSDNRALFAAGALYGPAVTQDHEYWRIATGAFLHGGLMHIAFNMFALYQVGTPVERFLGGPRMLAIYVLSMIGSGFAVVYFSPDSLTVGASGAIFGLFGALVGIGLRLGRQGRSLVAQVLPIVVINLVFTYTLPNISAAAHVGGLVTGFIVGIVAFELRPRHQPPPETAWVSEEGGSETPGADAPLEEFAPRETASEGP